MNIADLAGSVHVEPVPVAKPDDTDGYSHDPRAVQIEHPAIGHGPDHIMADHARFVYPRKAFDDLKLGSIGFKTDLGTFPAAVAMSDRGKQGVIVDVLVPFDKRIITGDLVPVADGDTVMSWSPGSHPILGVTSDTWKVVKDAVIADRSTALLRVRQLTLLNGELTAVLEIRTPFGSPVSRCTLAATRLKDTLDHWGYIKLDFGDGARVHISPAHARRCIFSAEGSSIAGEMLVGQCTFQSIDFAVVHANPMNYVDDQLIDAAVHDAPVARYDYVNGRCKEFLSVGKIVEPSLNHVSVMDQVVNDRYPHIRNSDYIYSDPDPFEKRLLDQNYVTSNSGSQRFGAAFSPTIHYLSPYTAWCFLLDSASGEQLRPHVWMMNDGVLLTHGGTPQVLCTNRRPFLPHSDKVVVEALFGGGVQSPAITGRSSEDPQHTDELALHAALGLWDRWELAVVAQQIVERDLAENRNYSHWLAGTRGEGRPWFSTANAKWLFDGSPTGNAAEAYLRINMDIMDEVWFGRRALERGNTSMLSVTCLYDPRLPVTDEAKVKVWAYMPYEHATVVTACLAAMNAVSDPALKLRFRNFGIAIGSTFHKMLPSWPDGRAQASYVQGVPGNPEDPTDTEFGKLPPAESLVVGSDSWKAWCRTAGSWNRWSVRASLAFRRLVADASMQNIFAAELNKANSLISVVTEECEQHADFWLRDECYRMMSV